MERTRVQLTASRRALAVAGVLCVPLVVCAVVLLTRPWVPVLDMAMTELRVRDVGGRHTPLIGLPGRIGVFPDQGSHPGPTSFYLMAIVYRLAGTDSWALQLSSLVINAGCLSVLTALIARRYRTGGLIAAALGGAVIVRGYGMEVLGQPWNPYFPVLIWMVAVCAAYLVLDGEDRLFPVVCAAATVAAQTHVPYLVPSVGIVAVAAIGIASMLRRGVGVAPRRSLIVGVVAGAALWLPPFVQEMRHRPGNISALIDHFTSPQEEPAIGLVAAVRVLSQQLDVLSLLGASIVSDRGFIRRASSVDSFSLVGLAVLVAWIAAAVIVGRRRRRGLYPLFIIGGFLLAVDTFAISRIFGKVWFYLILWMPTTAIVVMVGIVAAAWSELGDDRRARVRTTLADRRALAAAAAVVATFSALSVVGALRHHPPEESRGEPVRRLMPSVTKSLDDSMGPAVGPDGTYIIYWQEAVFSPTQGLALLNELDRRGYHVGVSPVWRVPATPQRVLEPGQFDAQIHLVSGPWIADWEAMPEMVKIDEVDARSERDRERFAVLQDDVIARLEAAGRDDLVVDAQRSIFGLSLRDDLPDGVRSELDEMIEIGVPVAIFFAPADATF